MIVSQVNSGRQVREDVYDSGLKLDDLPPVMEFDGQSVALNFLYFPTMFDSDTNKLEAAEPIVVKRAVSTLNMRNQNYYELPTISLIADTLYKYAQSPEEYFDFCMNGAPFVSYITSDPSYIDHLEQWQRDKHSLFRGIVERTYQLGIYHPESCLCMINNHKYNITDFTRAFNIGSQAIYSLPGFFVMALIGFIVVESNFGSIAKGIFSPTAPILGNYGATQTITTFSDYVRAYSNGDWLMNNLDAFLTVYSLASAVADFVGEMQNYDKNIVHSFQDVTPYEPLLDLLNWLVQEGALCDPFSSEIGYVLDDGIANAVEANQELYAAFKLISISSFDQINSPQGTLAIFYALVNLFSLREYFNIDSDIKFQYQQ